MIFLCLRTLHGAGKTEYLSFLTTEERVDKRGVGVVCLLVTGFYSKQYFTFSVMFSA